MPEEEVPLQDAAAEEAAAPKPVEEVVPEPEAPPSYTATGRMGEKITLSQDQLDQLVQYTQTAMQPPPTPQVSDQPPTPAEDDVSDTDDDTFMREHKQLLSEVQSMKAMMDQERVQARNQATANLIVTTVTELNKTAPVVQKFPGLADEIQREIANRAAGVLQANPDAQITQAQIAQTHKDVTNRYAGALLQSGETAKKAENAVQAAKAVSGSPGGLTPSDQNAGDLDYKDLKAVSRRIRERMASLRVERGM